MNRPVLDAALTGVGAALPEAVRENGFFTHLDTSDAWIVQRTGIRERRIVSSAESLADLATAASRRALADAAVPASLVTHVIVATSTADRITPGLAVEVSARLGLPQPAACDLAAGCSGFLYALEHAVALIEAQRAEHVIVCGAEALSRITDISDRATAPLLGDGAGAVLLSATPHAHRPTVRLGSDGDHIGLLLATRDEGFLRMKGPTLFTLAVDRMAKELDRTLRIRGIGTADIDLLVAHQANARIVQAVAKRLDMPPHRVYMNIERVGNTSAASIPVALAHAQDDRTLRPGALLGLAAFGAGLTWGAAVIDWKPEAASRDAETTRADSRRGPV
ncbi:beta-ketoacyl-ACP synthase 3 [Streptomyces sp. NPDC047097]|uniref:beta-ketoacyl-ACP synthase 3 n=1 Tax=Streptomyces sp. NPDC047097 TaxID=3155260 RepID=UPI00340742EB